MSMQVVVLAGGIGSRLRPWTNSIPKPLLPLLDMTLVEQVVSGMPTELVDQVIIAAGYKVSQMREYFSKADLDYDVVIVPEDVPLGTGGALRNCMDHVSGTFACFNGDVISSLDVGEMLNQHKQMSVQGTLGLWEVEDPTRFGIVGLDDNKMITKFKEKPKPEEVFSNLINAGSYILEEEVFAMMPEGKFSIEREIFPLLAEQGELSGFPFEGYFIDAGTPDSWLDAVEVAVANSRHNAGRVVDGSWFASQPSKNVQGGSMISDSVEIQENCSLTRSSILNGATIGRASKIENCLIGSNAVIGEECSLNGVIVDHDGNVPAGTSLRGGTWPPSD